MVLPWYSLNNSQNLTLPFPTLNVAAQQELREEGGDGGLEVPFALLFTSWHPKGTSTFLSCYSQLFSVVKARLDPSPRLTDGVRAPCEMGILA